MKRKAIAPGLYFAPNGTYWVRLYTRSGGRVHRSWKKLRSIGKRAAIDEARQLKAEPDKGPNFEHLARLYLQAHCPNRRLEGRPAGFCAGEKLRLANLLPYFAQMPAMAIRLKDCPEYAAWRAKRVKRGTGERAIDLELVTLSNVLNYAVSVGMLDINYVRHGRPRFRQAKAIFHCREFAPANGDEIHRIAEILFEHPRSEVMGWLYLFGCLTGCRKGELLRLRMDSAGPEQPGLVSGNYLFIRRSKGGVHPYVLLTPELSDMLNCFRYWHGCRFPSSPCYFPSPVSPRQPIDISAIGHALQRVSRSLGVKRTMHGARSYYVTLRRSLGISDAQIASEIGDSTVELIHQTYGDRPPNWTGGAVLSWLPGQGLPAWAQWRPECEKVVEL